jgi:hypothetical protein
MNIKARLPVQQAIEVQYGPAPDPKKNRSSVYCSICKSVGKPENVWSSYTPETVETASIHPERTSNENFETTSKSGNTASDSYFTSSGDYCTLEKNLNDDNKMDEDESREQHRSADRQYRYTPKYS